MRRRQGFTLVELLITIVIAAILITVAVPSYYVFIQNNRIADISNRLSASFNLARMEAIKRGARVSICPASNASFNACGVATQWAQGWIVFIDADENDAIENNNERLLVSEALATGSSIISNRAVVSYDSAGFLSSGALTMKLSATGCTGNNARTLSISTSGRLSIAQAAC